MANFPCEADLAYYNAKTEPLWAINLRETRAARGSSWRKPNAAELLDHAINAHTGKRITNGELAAHNLLAIISPWIKRRKDPRIKTDLAARLEEIAAYPGCVTSPQRRAGFARKWAARLRSQESK